ncbi:uncharacterized protein LOC111294869 [Durio zibethinus]|uniref:Uncharacterized protein LOC111294869 n=1 Tax=Durio zibethinus TaxID=66656 RepID=A0A6P5YUX4_DURZI|nr:uncharacterized protein LOC111294869 [Durio zibethinus]
MTKAIRVSKDVSQSFKHFDSQVMWLGFVCMRGFDQKTQAPRPLMVSLHFPAISSLKLITLATVCTLSFFSLVKAIVFARELEEHECKICFEEVKTEYGSYHCWREDCNYIVHVKCATEDDRLYYIIDQENQDEEPVVSSISCVVEVNEHGEAVKIFKHFKHEHNLVFEDKIKEDSDRHCDGCMLSISTPFYYCSVCNFFLHKTCAELPKIKHHWYRRFPFTLEARDFLRCKLCYRYCSGLFYISGRLYFCLRCATVPDIIRREGHEHLLFFDYQRKRQCSACGVGGGYGAFRCKECSFSLDFACMTLPQAIQHKCDSHLLKLTYHGENADAEQHYCDVCEEKQNPNHWYYYCSTCDNSVHPKCVLGEYPFLKDGITWRSVVLSTQRSGVFHEHSDDVIFVHKVDGYPECAACGKLCQDEALKCPKCNIIVHHKCRWIGNGKC